jgi:hypothetical protein
MTQETFLIYVLAGLGLPLVGALLVTGLEFGQFLKKALHIKD